MEECWQLRQSAYMYVYGQIQTKGIPVYAIFNPKIE